MSLTERRAAESIGSLGPWEMIGTRSRAERLGLISSERWNESPLLPDLSSKISRIAGAPGLASDHDPSSFLHLRASGAFWSFWSVWSLGSFHKTGLVCVLLGVEGELGRRLLFGRLRFQMPAFAGVRRSSSCWVDLGTQRNQIWQREHHKEHTELDVPSPTELN